MYKKINHIDQKKSETKKYIALGAYPYFSPERVVLNEYKNQIIFVLITSYYTKLAKTSFSPSDRIKNLIHKRRRINFVPSLQKAQS